MFEVMLSLHLLTAIVAIGPLAHTLAVAVRGVYVGDAAAIASSARLTTAYTYASVLVVIFGLAVMASPSPVTGVQVADFNETWIWSSALVWLVGALTALHVTAPALHRASTCIHNGTPIGGLKAKILASAGLITLAFTAVIVVMVYQPGR
jgi:hypothetical protein